MKAFLAILFLSLAALSNSLDDQVLCGTQVLPSNRDECTSSKLQDGIFKCCYEAYKVTIVTASFCRPLTEAQFKDIDAYIKERKVTIPGFTSYSLDCSSNYLTLSIISLILLLL